MSRRTTTLTGLIVLSALVACGPGGDAGARTPSDPGSGGTSDETPSSDESPTEDGRAGQALDDAGLALPDGAAGAGVEEVDSETFEDARLITFEATGAAVEAMCQESGGLNGPFPATSLTQEQQEVLGLDEPPAGTSLCSGSWPENFSVQRHVLFTDGDAPGPVWVGVLTYPR